MHKFKWAALLAAGVLAWGSSASAALNLCLSGCVIQNGFIFADYTVPSDGQTYSWDLFVSDPTVSVTLDAPNELFSIEKVSNGDGTTHNVFSPFAGYTWQETVAAGHTSIRLRGDPDFNTCGPSTPAGVICAIQQNVFGNGSELIARRNGVELSFPDAVTVTLAITAVPEPGTWALMLAGFFGLGAVLRRRRSALASA